MKIKKILIVVFLVVLVVVGFQGRKLLSGNKSGSNQETRSVWISYIEYSSILWGKSEKEYKAGVEEMFQNLKDLNMNTVYVHAVAFTDSFYPSKYYPYAKYCTGTVGKDPGFDPFKIMVDSAKKAGLKIEAWINPMRSLTDDQMKELDNQFLLKQWYLDTNKNGTYLVQQNDRWYLNPYYEEVRELITNVTKEIVSQYDVDGVHIDDYFYPEKITEEFDAAAYADYKGQGGKLNLSDFRRDNVNKMVKAMHDTVKKEKKNTVFGISPAGNMNYSIDEIYGDIEEWIKKDGYIDYIAPQIYFGYEHSTLPFDKCIRQWSDLVGQSKVKLIFGMAGYKINTIDNYAGDGKFEWTEGTDILKRQIIEARTLDNYGGFSIFSYNSLFKPKQEDAELVGKQLESVREALEGSK